VTAKPLVTVIVPARDEERDIAGCIDAVAAQDHGADRIQLVVVDAESTDCTVEEARRAAARHPFAEVVVERNPRRRTSTGLNIGLGHARGPYVARVDARSRIPSDYVSTCVAVMADERVGVVGGAQLAQPRSDRAVDRGIARALRNRWATGLSRYRRAATSGPSDTVWMGFFRTDELRALGGWAEAVALNEDYELNGRYRDRGRLVWFEAGLRSGYLPRPSLRLLGRQYFFFGRVKGLWWARGDKPAPRQVALLVVPVAAATAAWQGWRRFGPGSLLVVPAVLVGLEAAGSDGPADLRSHLVGAAAIAVLSGSWWIGVITGAAGEVAHVRHQHA
jgi:glycosyltransferase involved in cell wall biosynthesis